MANSDKNIVITPNVGASADDPKIVFSGADSATGPQNITLKAYPTSNGTVSFEGSAGQLFSITNDLSGTIFSVNDVSGIPSIEVNADGTVKIAEYSGNVLIGTDTDNGTDKLQINGSISATTFTGAVTGNATTATTLATARTIGGVSFNGSANIDLPGVNTAGNQNTSGSAATLTTARTIGGVSFDGSASIDLPGVNTAGTQNTSGTAAVSTAATITTSDTASAFKVPFANTTASTTGNYGLLQDSTATFTYNPNTNTLVVGTVSAALSGNATTATTLQTARTINGVSFDGSADITVVDATTVAAAGALMDSEVTNLAQVKAFDSADYATAAQGSTADSALQNISEDTTPQLGGNLDTNGYEISFDDDKYLKFGSSDDITIGHFSSVSANIIDALGALCISSDSSIIFKKENLLGETLAQMIPDGAVTLFYNGGQKFETTSTGIKTSGNIDVNGAYTLPTSDGTDGQSLITDGSGVLSWATPANATDADRVDGYHIAVVSSLPSSPDANTIYYIT